MILFVSDNGACPYDRRPPKLDVAPTSADISFPDSTGWAWARNTPFRLYKQNQFEGGISTPAIIHWPDGLKTEPGSITNQTANLIDVLPTLAEVTQSPIPDRWPERDLRPVSGISLAPVFQGKTVQRSEPLHLLFAQDRGLRDGDWKIVSFRRQAWELYNIANDRTESEDLAKQEPERLKSMVDRWTDMTRNLLHARPKVYAPTRAAEPKKFHPDWTSFAGFPPNRSTLQQPTKQTPPAIRARKNTRLNIVDNELRLQFRGEDPGIAIDLRRHRLPPGPYRVTFRLRGGCGGSGGSGGSGELYYTTDPKVSLPQGTRIEFDIPSDEEWHEVKVDLSSNRTLCQLRIDVCDGPGEATIRNLALLGKNDRLLVSWPKKK